MYKVFAIQVFGSKLADFGDGVVVHMLAASCRHMHGESHDRQSSKDGQRQVWIEEDGRESVLLFFQEMVHDGEAIKCRERAKGV